ncbi:hypothetical protein [Psychrobacillus lasiicapitis]|uniref:Uncharacterized protein n=1 Tax=Psychrobacillus lasiicapitis TaxID=1636719 RepID=A0A544SZQ4_9BACI|nr:hypothetical protein [Psychrobacillus lasiicapitis]TQR10672.1 hypothetical protein FG382_16490 [Psychrobacillus lasiicapitis]GGA43582.1 hypothetical protein GCM10011384_36730 [Psychrobacillus lasiicapitis]
MEPSNEFDELFEEMKEVKRSEKAKHNTWLALKSKIEETRKRTIFPAFISLAIIATASFLFITFLKPSETEKSAESLSNEETIKAVLEREYNGPNMEISQLMNDWMDLQSETETQKQEDYNHLLESKEYKDFMNYYPATFGAYFTENMLTKAIRTNLVFKYNFYLIDNDIEMKLENVKIAQEKAHPNIYRPIIEVSLTNSKGQKIFHTVREEFIFSKTEPGKIGGYNGVKDGGSMELREKIENFDAYVENNEDVRTPSIDVSYDTLCFNGRLPVPQGTVEFKSGCTSDRSQINSVMTIMENFFVKEVTEKEAMERSELFTQIGNYQIYLTNSADKDNTLYTITSFSDGFLVFSPGSSLGITGDITTESKVFFYEEIKQRLDEFADNNN